MDYLVVAASLTNLCLNFFSDETVALDIEKNGRKRVPSRDLSNSNLSPYFYCDFEYVAPTESFSCRSNAYIPYLDQYGLI